MAETKTAWFRRERPALSQESDSALHIWWGPIRTEKQAREIVAWTAWSLLLIGVAPGAALALSASHGEIIVAHPFYANRADNWYVLGQALFMTVEMAAAVLLLRWQSWIAALALLLCCAFVMTLILVTIARVATTGTANGPAIGEYVVLEFCLMFFTNLVWRAMEAASAIRRLTTTEQFD